MKIVVQHDLLYTRGPVRLLALLATWSAKSSDRWDGEEGRIGSTALVPLVSTVLNCRMFCSCLPSSSSYLPSCLLKMCLLASVSAGLCLCFAFYVFCKFFMTKTLQSSSGFSCQRQRCKNNGCWGDRETVVGPLFLERNVAWSRLILASHSGQTISKLFCDLQKCLKYEKCSGYALPLFVKI